MRLTLLTCEGLNKPYLLYPTARELHAWLFEGQIRVLNVAGNRESQLTAGQRASYRALLLDGLSGSRRLGMLFHPQADPWGLRGDRYPRPGRVCRYSVAAPDRRRTLRPAEPTDWEPAGRRPGSGPGHVRPPLRPRGHEQRPGQFGLLAENALSLLRKRFREATKPTA